MFRASRRVAVVICGAVFLLACGKPEEPPREPSDVSAAEVKEEAREAADAAEDYVATQRRKLAKQAQRAVADVDRQLSEARGKARELPDRARLGLEAAIDHAERAQGRLRAELEELREAGAQHWEETRERVANALDEVSEARREIGAALAGVEERPGE